MLSSLLEAERGFADTDEVYSFTRTSVIVQEDYQPWTLDLFYRMRNRSATKTQSRLDSFVLKLVSSTPGFNNI